jgi:hypothetical protein
MDENIYKNIHVYLYMNMYAYVSICEYTSKPGLYTLYINEYECMRIFKEIPVCVYKYIRVNI